MQHQTDPISLNKVLAVNDLSSVGKCSLGVIIPILSAMKADVCPLVTTVLSAHTGFDNPYIVDLTPHLDQMFTHIFKESSGFRFAYSGYLGSNRQIEIVLEQFRRLKTQGTRILVDPVLGDNGKLYSSFNGESVGKMRLLCEAADLITPNYTEACLLAEKPMIDAMGEEEALRLAQTLAIRFQLNQVVVTGVPVTGGKVIAVWDGQAGKLIHCDYVKGEYCGTGDAFASVLCGSLLKGVSLYDSAVAAHRFVRLAISETYARGGNWKDGIMVEAFLDRLW